jgi:hypothetical protein
MKKRGRNTNARVIAAASSTYGDWRTQHGAPAALREGDHIPPERLLQVVWQHQRILREQLRTLDGRRVRILHPGFANPEGGPDFRGAVVQFDHEAPVSGDVEVDLRASGWRAHGHDRNPAFSGVILHVIWEGDKPAEKGPPTLPLGAVLDAPLHELNLWLVPDAPPGLPENLRGQCSGPMSELSTGQCHALLLEAAQVRFQAKAAHFEARAREAGWEQALWEGLFRALGYKHNAWPMQCLAERRARWMPPRPAPLALQARLLGLSGLLPSDLTREQAGADGYLRRVWDQWWRERDEFEDCALPRSVWRLHRQRPANHPQRRLALAAHWLAEADLPARLERWAVADPGDASLVESLAEILRVEHDEFWDWHWTMRSGRLGKRQPLLGVTRVTDLAINVILPWLWVRAAGGRSAELQTAIELRYQTWPRAEDNSVLRLARQRLFGGASAPTLKTAAEQQGILQIVRDFCDRSNAICTDCRFPELAGKYCLISNCSTSQATCH